MGTRWGQVGVWVTIVLGLGWHAAIADAQQTTAESNVTEKTPVDPLVTEVQEAIDITTRRYLSGEVHTPWQIMHGLLALRQDYRIKRKGEKVSAVNWISSGATYKGDPWFQKTRYGGRAHPFSRPKVFEGHPNQTLAILAMADVPLDHKLVTRGTQTISVADLVRNAQMEITTGQEVTWTLWALSHYLGPDASWRNKQGQSWSIERMVRIQTQEPVSRAACGGSHGLFALTFARNVYLKTGKPLRGIWLSADQKIQRYIREAQANQNRDWSFSTNYFSGRRFSRDFETRLNTSGHTLEFLVLALPKERLDERWIRNGVFAVTNDLRDNQEKSAECASLYHALNALVIYRDRKTQKADPAIAAKDGGSVSVEPQTALRRFAATRTRVMARSPDRAIPPTAGLHERGFNRLHERAAIGETYGQSCVTVGRP